MLQPARRRPDGRRPDCAVPGRVASSAGQGRRSHGTRHRMDDRTRVEEFARRATEQRNPRTLDLDTLDVSGILERIAAEDRGVPAAVARELPWIARAVELVVASFREGGRLIYVGAGTSGRLGVLDASECPPTFGSDPDQVQGI